MVPMYAARVEDLTHHEIVTALCASCGHIAEILVADLWRKLPAFKRIADIRIRCTRLRRAPTGRAGRDQGAGEWSRPM